MSEIRRLAWVSIFIGPAKNNKAYTTEGMDAGLLERILVEYLEGESSNASGIFKIETEEGIILTSGLEPHSSDSLVYIIDGSIKDWNVWIRVRIINDFTGIT